MRSLLGSGSGLVMVKRHLSGTPAARVGPLEDGSPADPHEIDGRQVTPRMPDALFERKQKLRRLSKISGCRGSAV
jgi:hypothetical protein